MARRKTKRVQVKKVYKAKLETSFACPFCNEESSVGCKLDRLKQIGITRCRQCQAGYQTVINCKDLCSMNNCASNPDPEVDLSEPVDVFAEWVDAIDAQNRQTTAKRQRIAAEAQWQPPKANEDNGDEVESVEGE